MGLARLPAYLGCLEKVFVDFSHRTEPPSEWKTATMSGKKVSKDFHWRRRRNPFTPSNSFRSIISATHGSGRRNIGAIITIYRNSPSFDNRLCLTFGATLGWEIHVPPSRQKQHLIILPLGRMNPAYSWCETNYRRFFNQCWYLRYVRFPIGGRCLTLLTGMTNCCSGSQKSYEWVRSTRKSEWNDSRCLKIG